MKGNLYTENEKKFRDLIIRGNKYKILICDLIEFNNEKYIGFVDYKDNIIFIDGHLKKEDFELTLIHEILHAFLNEILRDKKIKDKKIIRRLRSDESFIETASVLIKNCIGIARLG